MVRRPMHAPEGRRLLTATSIRHGVTIPSAEYYAYDGPIYVGHSAEPPDKVIADVQAVLQQQMGYYQGEVDGLLGPVDREALAAYQADQGLATTAAIDEPTLDSLRMGKKRRYKLESQIREATAAH